MRKLVVVAVACSTFGGAVGALVTATAQSQADPAAIAAAVQKVQDQRAEGSLTAISSKLNQLGKLGQLSKLSAIDGDIKAFATAAHTDAQAISSEVNNESRYLGIDDSDLALQLLSICRNTAPAGRICETYSPPLR
jgi:hypothetical protein